MSATARSNPFATRFTRPGAIDFLFAESESVEALVAKLQGNRWWGQIIGPHGSGKSTLLAACEPALREAGREVVRRTVSSGQRQLDSPVTLTPSTLLIIDGYEQLSWWSRWRVKAACRRHGAGLLVTAHRDVGLPTIYRTQPTLDLARKIVSRLLPSGDFTISSADLAAAYERHPENLRELLFALYDLYQARAAQPLRLAADHDPNDRLAGQ